MHKKILESIPFGCIQVDLSGKIVYANSSALELLELEADRLINLSYDGLPWDQLNEEYEPLKKEEHTIFQALNGRRVNGAIRMLKINERFKWFSVNTSPFHDDEGQLIGAVANFTDITEKIKSDLQVKQEKALKQEILDALSDGVLVVNSDGQVVSINRSIAKYIEKEQLIDLGLGVPIFKFIDQLPESQTLRKALQAILRKEISSIEHQLQLADDKWYNIRVNPLEGDYGAVLVFQNINTRKEIETALEKSLKKYRNIYNKAPVMMHSVDKDGKIISVSDYWLDKMGYDRNEIIGKSPKYFLSTASNKLLEEQQSTSDKNEVENVEYEFIKKSGEIMNVLLGSVDEYDEYGEFERSIAGMIDITEQKKVEQDLKESSTRLLEAQRISKIGNYELDVITKEFTSSRETNMIMGLSGESNQLDTVLETIHPDDLKVFTEKLNEAIQTGQNFFHEYRIYHLRTGNLRWLSGRGRMIKDGRGVATSMIGTVQDISEQKTAEDKIKRLSDRLLLATEIANLGVWEFDRDSDTLSWEDQMYVIFAGLSEPIPLKDVAKIIVDDGERFMQEKTNLIKSGVSFIEAELKVNVEEQIKYVRTFTRIIRRENGSFKGMIGVVYDITPDKKLQNELEYSLDEKNILVREVHHRVKNNMQLISSIMALKAYDLEDEDSKLIFEEVNTRIKAMSVIHDRLYKFYNVSEIEIQDFLTNVAGDLNLLLGLSSLKFEVEVAKGILTIDQALLIGLIVTEMVSNAVKHSFDKPPKGTINIQFATQEAGRYLLRVTNDGKSIAPDVLTSNSGIGISLIKTFATQLKGELAIDSENGFRVEF